MRERLRRTFEALLWFAPALVALNFVYRDFRHPRLLDGSIGPWASWLRRLDRCIEYAGESERVLFAMFFGALIVGTVVTVFYAFKPPPVSVEKPATAGRRSRSRHRA